MVERHARTVLLHCDDHVEYATAITARRDLEASLGFGFVPILGRSSESESVSFQQASSGKMTSALAALSTRELADACARSISPRANESTHLVAYVHGDDDAYLCATAFAAFAGRRLFVLDGDDRGLTPTSITVVVSSTLLDAKGTDWVQHRVRALFPADPPCGILTAHDEQTLSVFVARSLLRTPKPKGIAEVAWVSDTRPFGIDEEGVSHVPDMRTMPPPELRSPTLRKPSADQPMTARVLFYRGHSREYCGQSGRLCSRKAWSEEKLACVRGLECVTDGWARTPARDVESDAVFLDSCMGARVPGALEPLQNVTLQLIEAGTSAVFTSAGRYYIDEFTPLLSLRLMASGWSFGRVAHALNRVLRQRYGALGSILLFGDPEGLPYADREALPELDAKLTRGASGWDEITFPVTRPIASEAEVFLVRGEAVRAIGEGAPHHCYRHPDAPAGMGAMLLRLDDLHAALLVLGGRGAVGDLVFSQRPPFDVAQAAAAAELVERLVLLPTSDEAGLSEQTTALRRIVETRAIATGATRLGISTMEQMSELTRYERSITDAATALAMEHARASCRAINFGGWLDSYYLEAGKMDMLPETFGLASCPACGLPMLTCHYQVFGAGRPTPRERFECERCGVICDVVEHTHPIWLESPVEVRLGDRFEAHVHGVNDTGLPLFLGADAFVAYVDPAKCEVAVVSCPSRVDPQSPFTITFGCRVDPAVRAHAYDFRALLSMNGALALANRRVIYTR